jgi:hypothetical protein
LVFCFKEHDLRFQNHYKNSTSFLIPNYYAEQHYDSFQNIFFITESSCFTDFLISFYTEDTNQTPIGPKKLANLAKK